jgi:hypothetical protein
MDWPGNVRELPHALERACIVASGDRLRFDFPEAASSQRLSETGDRHTTFCASIGEVLMHSGASRRFRTACQQAKPSASLAPQRDLTNQESRAIEASNLRLALTECHGNSPLVHSRASELRYQPDVSDPASSGEERSLITRTTVSFSSCGTVPIIRSAKTFGGARPCIVAWGSPFDPANGPAANAFFVGSESELGANHAWFSCWPAASNWGLWRCLLWARTWLDHRRPKSDGAAAPLRRSTHDTPS